MTDHSSSGGLRGSAEAPVIPNPVLAAALDYIAGGWPVMPIVPRGKKPACTHGKDDASTDHAQIADWFDGRPDLNIGIVTGARSLIAVLDVDPRNGGNDSLDKLQADFGSLPETRSVATGGGGVHFYFAVRGEQASALADANGLPGYPGLDFKCGGYVVAPASTHQTGRTYEWLNEAALAPLPRWLAEIKARRAPPTARRAPEIGSDQILEGGRNDALMRKGARMRGRGCSGTEIAGALQEINRRECKPPLDEHEVATIAVSVMRWEPNSHPANTDLDRAREFIAALKGDLRYFTASKRWYWWTGTHWMPDSDGEITRRVAAFLDLLLEAARLIDDKVARDRAVAAAMAARSVARMKAIVELATTIAGVPVTADELDSHPDLLNVKNGTIDLRTGNLREHLRDDLITCFIPIGYDPAAPRATWLAFLEDDTGGDRELLGFLQRSTGYGATGHTSEQCLFFLHGEGANGKSTYLEAIRGVLGPYSAQAATSTLMVKSSGNIPSDLARLSGKRFVTAAEAAQGQRMDDSLIKQMTGGENLTVRELYGVWFELPVQFKLFFATNHRPQLSGMDPAIWRRIREIPFSRVIPTERRDRDLPAKLQAEAAGILAWIVEGASSWHRNGLGVPEVVVAATESYRQEMDPIGAFIEERCERIDGHEVKACDLFSAYRMWAAMDGREAVIQYRFGSEMQRRGIHKKRRGGIIYRCGLSLASSTSTSRIG